MGTGKEGAKDGRLRAGLHAEWAKEQDQAEMAAVVAGMQRGWRKPGGNAFEDDEYEVRCCIVDSCFQDLLPAGAQRSRNPETLRFTHRAADCALMPT